ncbi:CPCC family cysteine-rich protein [Streptomyces sp. NPDC055692]|uniref:CPCC family cysteine-rich protein n=1 Tax=Streptomyces sp. NPDC055692 TaxID=3155683 RepID=UPI00341401B4
MADRRPCPCCGHLIHDEPRGSNDICPVCFWEDDLSQLRWPTTTGVSRVSLREAQRNVQRFGICDQRGLRFARRPLPDEPLAPSGTRSTRSRTHSRTPTTPHPGPTTSRTSKGIEPAKARPAPLPSVGDLGVHAAPLNTALGTRTLLLQECGAHRRARAGVRSSVPRRGKDVRSGR